MGFWGHKKVDAIIVSVSGEAEGEEHEENEEGHREDIP